MSRKKMISLLLLALIFVLAYTALRTGSVRGALQTVSSSMGDAAEGAKKAVRGISKNATVKAMGVSGLQGVVNAIAHALQNGTKAFENVIHAMLGR